MARGMVSPSSPHEKVEKPIPQLIQPSYTSMILSNDSFANQAFQRVGNKIEPQPSKVDLLPSSSKNSPQISNKTLYADVVKGVSLSVPLPSSEFQTSNVDLQSLNPISTFQGKPAVLFSTSDRNLLVEKLQFVLVGKFSHGRPSSRSIKLFFINFKPMGAISFSVFDKKHIFIECLCKEDYYRIWLGLSWLIDGLAMRVFKWSADFSPLKESTFAPVWIRVHGLPLYMFDEKALMSLANTVGKPIKVDPRNLSRTISNTAWICVELDVQQPLIEDVWVSFVEEGKTGHLDGFWVKFHYDMVPPFCSFCQHIGHNHIVCKRSIEQATSQGSNRGNMGMVCENMVCQSSLCGLQQGRILEEGELDENLEHNVGKDLQECVREVHAVKGIKQLTGMLVNPFVRAAKEEAGVMVSNEAHVKADCNEEGVQQLPPVLEQKKEQAKLLPCSAGTGLVRLDLDMQERVAQGQNFELAAADSTRQAWQAVAEKESHKVPAGPPEELLRASTDQEAEYAAVSRANGEHHGRVDQEMEKEEGEIGLLNVDTKVVPSTQSWADLMEEEQVQHIVSSPKEEASAVQVNETGQGPLKEDKEGLLDAFALFTERMNRLRGKEPDRKDVRLPEKDDYAKKEMKIILSRPSEVDKIFDTSLPFDFDPTFSDDEGNTMTWSKLTKSRLKVLAARSLSPVGRSSEKLSKLRTKVDYLKCDERTAIILDKEYYKELDDEDLRQQVSAFKEQRKASSTKNSTEIVTQEKITDTSQVDEQDWTPAKRRGRNRNRKK